MYGILQQIQLFLILPMSCKSAVNATTQGFMPFVDSAELACRALTAQRWGWNTHGCSTLL